MKKIIFLAIFVISTQAKASEGLSGYAAKCAELIEQSKSPASNWTTSLEEAAMAGECIGVIEVVNNFIDKHYANRREKYSCRNNSTFSKAQMIVDANAQSISSVIKTLCIKY